MDKKFLESKKSTGLLIGIGSVIATSALGIVTGGITTAVALPMTIDAIKWLVISYFGIQGGQDIAAKLKNEGNNNQAEMPTGGSK